MICNSTVIDESAVIENNVSVGPGTVIGKNVIIRSGTAVGSKCFIEHAEIKGNCRVGDYVSLGTPPQDTGYRNEPSKVYIGEGTVIGNFVTVNRGTKKTLKTVIGKNCILKTSSHVGHDCVLEDNVELGEFVALGGHVQAGEGTVFANLSGVHQFVKLGKMSFVAERCVVRMDVIPYSSVAGSRTILKGLNLKGLYKINMSFENFMELSEAYRVLFMSNLLLNEAVEKLSGNTSVYVKEIVDFINASHRGIVRHH